MSFTCGLSIDADEFSREPLSGKPSIHNDDDDDDEQPIEPISDIGINHINDIMFKLKGTNAKGRVK